MKINVHLSDSNDLILFHQNIPTGVRVSPQPIIRKGFGLKEAVDLVIDITSEVEISLFTAWLIDTFVKCKRNKGTGDITINRREFHFKNGEIEKIIEETINSSQNKS